MFHIIVSDGEPHSYGIKSTCGASGFLAKAYEVFPATPFCEKACSISSSDCDECRCAVLVANEFNALPNFDTYTVSILEFKQGNQGTDAAFESAKATMQVSPALPRITSPY